MQVYYAPGIQGHDHHILDTSESRHLVRVLRMKKGAPVFLIDGIGNLYNGVIEDPDQNGCRIAITSVTPDFEKRNYRLHVAISSLKNPERFEWFVEKAVETGIDEISVIICRNTEKANVRLQRLRNIMISAMKQSLKARETIINEPVTFSEFLNTPHSGKLMIAHCYDDSERKKVPDIYNRGDDALILIGPEGDFTRDEVNEAINRNFSEISFGKSRLRTETAGIAACLSVYMLNQ
ncbi:MAG: 16S rRNA (uracil(1498)-N(3))-methyltransferase [Bacteroidales bacterium]|nr:16S rRNA (uracil(1498)-N(3))-methyltransferase [Bacteroidales bacterium]